MRYLDVIATLNRHGVKFVVVGGMAVIMHGHPRKTKDLDNLVDLSPENARALAAALREAGYAPKVPVRVEDLGDPAVRASWVEDKGMKALMFWKNRSGDVDVLVTSPVTYEEATRGGPVYEVEGTPVPIASIPALVSMKRHAGRPHDLDDVDALERISAMMRQEDEA